MKPPRDDKIEEQEIDENSMAAILLKLTEIIVKIRKKEGLTQKQVEDLFNRK